MTKTYSEINEKIKRGKAAVITADEMTSIVKEKGATVAAEEVDVVTTGTFGCMCSSGVFINLGHTDPPIKIRRAWLNDVEVSNPGAAVDLYIGAPQVSASKGIEYGGGHLIEDLVSNKPIKLRAEGSGTDCYPRESIETTLTLKDLNQAIMVNPRNGYQRYHAATNSSDLLLYTYMGMLLPQFGNVTYAGAGGLNPLSNDPFYQTIGIGTRIFLGGGPGYIIGEGTQHDPANGMGTLMVRGDLKKMSPKYLRGATFPRYGSTLYIGVGIPIPILNAGIARSTGVSDAEIPIDVLDYGVKRRDRPIVKSTNYEELREGTIGIQGKEVKTGCLSSLKIAREIAQELKRWIEEEGLLLTEPVEPLPKKGNFEPMRMGGTDEKI